jgi:hypothetical protein
MQWCPAMRLPAQDFALRCAGGPCRGADAVANNQFVAADHVSGSYLPVSSPSVLANTVFGARRAG